MKTLFTVSIIRGGPLPLPHTMAVIMEHPCKLCKRIIRFHSNAVSIIRIFGQAVVFFGQAVQLKTRTLSYNDEEEYWGFIPFSL